eukprot:scaffold49995_cov53-Phaeocystis_antarctica.AAC.1
MPRFQVPPPLRGFRGSEVSEVIWTLKLIGTVTELGRWRVPRRHGTREGAHGERPGADFRHSEEIGFRRNVSLSVA